MKNKIFSLILLALLSLSGVNVVAEVVKEGVDFNTSSSMSEQVVVADDTDLIPETEIVAEGQTLPSSEPTQREKLVRKFLTAMLGVVVSSLILYVGLSVYNKVRENILNQVKTPEGETSLETPNDLSGAVKTFLEKTNWG